MFPHLMGMKDYNNLSSDDMGAIAGISRQTFDSKMSRGTFNVEEIKAYCQYFKLPFEYLFATADEAKNVGSAFVRALSDEGKTIPTKVV